MREIKFRVWHAGQMLTQPINTPFGVSRFFGFLDTVGVHAFDNVMQFTGLHDKNGKEIYEGDVVFAVGNQARYTVVFGSYKSFGEDEPDYHCGFYLKRHNSTFIEGLGESEKYFEIIGNIHENPQLVEGKG